MKKSSVVYTATLGIFWEVVYVIVVIGVGLLFSGAMRYMR